MPNSPSSKADDGASKQDEVASPDDDIKEIKEAELRQATLEEEAKKYNFVGCLSSPGITND